MISLFYRKSYLFDYTFNFVNFNNGKDLLYNLESYLIQKDHNGIITLNPYVTDNLITILEIEE